MNLYYSPGACSPGSAHPAPRDRPRATTPVRVDLKTKMLEDGSSYLDINPKGAVPALAARQRRGADRERGRSSNISATAPSSPKSFRRSATSAATACSRWSISSPPSCTRVSRSCSIPRRPDETKQLVTASHRQEARLCRQAARRRARSCSATTLTLRRPLSVRDDRLGGQGARHSTAGPTSRAFHERMLQRPSVRHVLQFEGLLRERTRRLAALADRRSRPRAAPHDPVRPHRRPAPDPGDGAQVHCGRDHARSPPSGTRSTSSRATRSARRPSSASARSTSVRGERRHRPRPARGGADHGGDGLRLPLDQRLHLDPQHGGVDDRPLRLGRGEAEISAVDDHAWSRSAAIA